MPACESKFVSRSSRKATVAKIIPWVGPGLVVIANPRSPWPGALGAGLGLTRIRNVLLVLRSNAKRAEQWLCVEQSCEFLPT